MLVQFFGKRDVYLILSGLIALFLSIVFAKFITEFAVDGLVEKHSIERATTFSNSLMQSLKPFSADGKFNELSHEAQNQIFDFAKSIEHIDRVLFIDISGYVVFDSYGKRNGHVYSDQDFKRAIDLKTTVTKRDRSIDIELYNSVYIFEAYCPVIVGDKVLGLMELYFDLGDYARTIISAANLCFMIFSISVSFSSLMIFFLYVKSIHERNKHFNFILSLKNNADQMRHLAERSMQSQKRLLANVSHELRTPIAILKARLDSIASLENKAKLSRDVDRLARLVDQMLSISIIEGRRISCDDNVNLNFICRDVVADTVPIALDEGKEIQFYSSNTDATFRVNKFYFSQALKNLLENAIRYTPTNGKVEIFLKEGPVIEVCDRGPGIPLQLRNNLFEPFVQGRDRKGNAGLGLSIVAETIRFHGGSIVAEDRVGGGTIFRITL